MNKKMKKTNRFLWTFLVAIVILFLIWIFFGLEGLIWLVPDSLGDILEWALVIFIIDRLIKYFSKKKDKKKPIKNEKV
jgi:uncharacterized membrane protein YkvI